MLADSVVGSQTTVSESVCLETNLTIVGAAGI